MLVLKGWLPHPLSPGNFAKFDKKVKGETAWKSSNYNELSMEVKKLDGH